MSLIQDILFTLSLVGMEGVVLWLVFKIVVAESVFEAGNHCVEVFDVNFIICIYCGSSSILFVVDENIGNLFTHLWRYMDRDEGLSLGFK